MTYRIENDNYNKLIITFHIIVLHRLHRLMVEPPEPISSMAIWSFFPQQAIAACAHPSSLGILGFGSVDSANVVLMSC